MKKIKSIKIILLFIVIALISGILFSCGDGDNAAPDNTGGNQNQADSQNNQNEETEEVRLYPDLPAVDWGGYEFTFLTRELIGVVDWEEWNHRDLFAEALNGDIINDVVYNRNKKIEEKYNITINEVGVSDRNGIARRTVRSGDDVYDVVSVHLMDVAPPHRTEP